MDNETGFRIYGDLTDHIDVKVECIMDINIIKQCAKAFTVLGALYDLHDWAASGADVSNMVLIIHGPDNCEFGLLKTEYGTVKIRSSKILPPGGFTIAKEVPEEKPKLELVKN